MSEPESEQEAAQDLARRLFGSQPEPEPKAETEPIKTEAKESEPKGEAGSTESEAKPEPSSPEERHQQFLGNLLGGAAKREVDERFFHPPPTKEGDE